MSLKVTRRLLWWDRYGSDSRATSKIWESLNGNPSQSSFTRHKAIPRHLHSYFEGSSPRTQEHLRWFPFKQELTVNNHPAMSVNDLLALYLPPMLNDDERVKYTALKTNQREQDVAMHVFEMRRLREVVAQTVRNKLRARSLRLIDGQMLTERERLFQMAAITECVRFESTSQTGHSFDPHVVYSPHYKVGGCIDIVSECPLKTALRYHVNEVSVDKAIPRGVLPDVVGLPKYPLHNFEPTIYNITMLKLSILALILKLESYVTDFFCDTGHLYMATIFHVTDDPTCRSKVKADLHRETCDLDLARAILDHHYETRVGPKANMRLN